MWPISLLSTAAFVTIILVGLPSRVNTAVDPRTGKECVNDTQTILDAEVAATDDSKSRVYNLCSDTVFPIGVYDGSAQQYENGMPAIEAFRANLHIVCGDDGKRDNNCTLSGGGWHLEVGTAEFLLIDATNSTTDIVNVTVSGVTFTNVTDGNVYLLSDPSITSNQITFSDCLFANNNAFDIIAASQPNSIVNVYNCSFLNNTLKARDENSATTAILLSEYAPKFNVTDCDFRNNDLTTTEPNHFSAVIYGTGVDIPGTEVNISNSCFVNNVGYTFGTVVIERNASIVNFTEVNNFEDGTTAVANINYECNGVGRVISTGAEGIDFSAECLSEFDAPSCALDATTNTTVSPSPFPVTAQAPITVTNQPPSQAPAADTSYSAKSTNYVFVHVCLCIVLFCYLNGFAI